MAGGRPSKYKPEYCEMLVKHMATGLSFESFAAVIDVSEETIHAWARPEGAEFKSEFSESKRQGFSKNRIFWERAGIQGLFEDTDGPKINSSIWQTNMKNRFRKEWTDTQKIESKVELTAKTEVPTGDQLLEAMANDPAFKNKVKK